MPKRGSGSVAFRVFGKPKTQGSMWSPKGSHAVIHQSGDVLKSWREMVGYEARAACACRWRSSTWNGRPPTRLQ